MYKSSLIFWLVLVCISCTHGLSVTRAMPVPDYPLTKDVSDLQQLADGRQTDFPIWENIDSVGWNKTSPVVLEVLLDSAEQKKRSPNIRIHSAVGSYAGVQPIKHVDVYTLSVAGDSLLHVGQYHQDQPEVDRAKYFIDIPLAKADEKLFIVIHVQSGGIYLDEIEYGQNFQMHAENFEKIGEFHSANYSNVVREDSSERLKNIYKKESDNVISAASDNKDEFPIIAVDCLSSKLDAAMDEERPLYINKDFQWEGQKCYSLQNRTSVRQNFKITYDKNLTAYKVENVILRNGKAVSDALVPLESNNSVSVEPNAAVNLWIDYGGDDLTPGMQKIKIDAGRTAREINFPIVLVACRSAIERLDLNVWSYSKNLPIWKIKTPALNNLQDSDVNIITIHPGYFPSLKSSQEWSSSSRLELIKELKRYTGFAKKYLLVAGWKRDRDFNVDMFGRLDDKSKESLRLWVGQLNKTIQQSGIDKNKIVLYPVDEPFGDKWEDLDALASEVKHIDPAILIYANPTYERKGTASLRQLENINPYIDVWQPHWEYVINQGKSFYFALNKPWWIFEVPEYPAKFARTDLFYRGLAWRALAVGASGIGVWSFDDTRGTSAWDDFDGESSDWSLVYESSEFGIIESRRWKAVKRGINEVRIVNMSNDTDLKDRLIAGKISELDMNSRFYQAISACKASPQ